MDQLVTSDEPQGADLPAQSLADGGQHLGADHGQLGVARQGQQDRHLADHRQRAQAVQVRSFHVRFLACCASRPGVMRNLHAS